MIAANSRLTAITRAVSPALQRCELTFVGRRPIDIARAEAQHAAYRRALERAGAAVEVIPADDRLPDAPFVEDTAVVFDEIAVIARPGAPSRRAELDAVALALSRYRPLTFIQAPATLDGGDVLRIGRECFVGLSTRTNADGAGQLSAILGAHGYRVTPVVVTGCLHLKSAVAAIGADTVLVNPAWIDASAFRGYRWIDVPDTEPFAADCLVVDGVVHVSTSYPRTLDLIRRQGFVTEVIEISEFEKAEGGLTCLSLLVEERDSRIAGSEH